MKRRLLSVILLLLSCLVPVAGHAADATELFVEGQRLYKEGQVEPALAMFREALKLSGSPNARLYMGRCLQDLGHLSEAYEEMERAMREAASLAATDVKYVSTRDAAAAQIAIMSTKVGKIVVALLGNPANVIVRVNGKDLPEQKYGTPVPLEPGAVTVTAIVPEQPLVERKVELRAGQTVTVTLDLRDPGKTAQASVSTTVTPATADTGQGTTQQPPPPPPPVDEGPSEFTPLRALGLVSTIVGVGGLVAFGVTGSLAKNAESDLESNCTGGRCPPAFQDTIDKGKTYQTVANVTLVAGSVLVAAGVALLIFGGPGEEEEGAAGDGAEPASGTAAYDDASLAIGPDGAFAAYTWHF